MRRLPRWLVLLLCFLLFLQPAYWIGLLDVVYAAGNVSDSFADSTKIDAGNSSGHLVTGGQVKMDQGNYFGDGSDGDVTISSDTSITNTEDGDYVVKEYSSLTVNSSTTLTTQNRSKGLFIYVQGNATINGTLSMTARGAYADPAVHGVSATGLRLPMIKSGSTDTLAAADFTGAGTTVSAAVTNQPGISGNGKIYTIEQVGGAGAAAAADGPADGYPGGTKTNGTGGGGGGANGNNALHAQVGGDGTCFSGGSASGGYGRGGTEDTTTDDIGGPGGDGAGAPGTDFSQQEGGGGAGNPGGTGDGGGNNGSDGTGGVIWLIVGGDLTIGAAGSIEAEGSDGGSVSDQGGGGGASGGGVVYVLYAGSLSNSGSVSVAGGTGGAKGTTGGKGGNGGAGYSSIEQVDSTAYSSTIQSTNLLSGASNVSNVSSFVYNLSAKPAGTGATIQFSQDGSNWYNSSGSLGGTDTLSTGVDNSIDTSGLEWSGSNFYYKVSFTSSDGVTTPVLDDVKVNYLQAPVAPTIGGATTLSTSSIRWNFTDNASNETGFRVFDTSNTQKAECSTADLSYCDETGLSTNTSYTRKVAGYNGDGNGVYSSTASKYTFAVPAATPSVSNAQASSLDVVLDNSTNPAATEMALYKEAGASCDGSGGSYVAADGSDNGSTPVWQDEASWGTVTVTGLTEMTEYGFCTIARNGDSVSTAWSGVDSGTTIEDTPPSISSVDSVAGDVSATYYDQTDDSSTVISFTSTDGLGGGVSACKWDTSDVAYDSMGNSCGSTSSCTADLSGEGSKTVYIRCGDVYGNKMASSQQVDYVIDATAPSSLSAGNSSSSWVKDKPSVVVSSPSDGGSGLAEIRYVWDSNDLGADCSGGSVTSGAADLTSSLSSGSHVLYLCAKDNAGNVTSWNGAYKWDGGNPLVNITTHVLTSYRASNIPAKIEGTASDAISAVASVAVSIYNGAMYWSGTVFDSISRVWMSATGTDIWEYTFSPSSDGSYTIRSRSTDSAGNTQESSDTSFEYDTGTPTISVSEASTPSTSSVVITWSTNEASSTQVEYGTSSSYGSTTAESDTAVRVSDHSKSVSGLESCVTYHYRVKSSDGAGNQLVGSDKTFTTTGCVGDASVETQTEGGVDNTVGGSVELQESGSTKISLSVPVNFSDTSADFQIKKINKNSVLLATSTPSSTKEVIGSNVYQLDALKSVDEKISSFNEAITITMNYTDDEVSGKDESTLQIYRWDGSSWNALDDCSVNTVANQISCTTTNFSTFVLFGEDAASEGGGSSASVVESYSTDECSGQAPGFRAPWIYGAIPQSSSSIKLFMTDGDQPINKYLLVYGEEPGVYKYGTEEMGGYGGGFKQYVVSDLKPGTTYYFKVVGKNGCKFGSWSNEMRMSTLGGSSRKLSSASKSRVIKNVSDDQLVTEIDNKMNEGGGIIEIERGGKSWTIDIKERGKEVSGQTETVTVSRGESLWSIADEVKGDGYEWTELVKMNKDKYPSLEKNPGYIEIGWELKVDKGGDLNTVEQVKGVSDSSLSEAEGQTETVTVSRGESLWSIADEVRGDGYEWTELVEMNKDRYPSLEESPGYIEIGWELKVDKGGDLNTVEQVKGVSDSSLSEAEGQTETVTVSRGESLWSIADEVRGDGYEWTELVEMNKDRYPSLEESPGYIEIGWELRVDRGDDLDAVEQVGEVSYERI